MKLHPFLQDSCFKAGTKVDNKLLCLDKLNGRRCQTARNISRAECLQYCVSLYSLASLIRVMGPQFGETAYISELNRARKVKSDEQVRVSFCRNTIQSRHVRVFSSRDEFFVLITCNGVLTLGKW